MHSKQHRNMENACSTQTPKTQTEVITEILDVLASERQEDGVDVPLHSL